MARLSILIPSIPTRFPMAEKLYNHIQSLVGDMDIEVLLLMDNKKITIGEKREVLKNISNGDYFMFCDDDDWIESLSEIYAATEKNVDVIDFKQKCRNKDGSDFIVTFKLGNEVEHKTDKNGNYIDLNRPPFHVCAWNKRFKAISYPPLNYSEDWEWTKKALYIAKTEYFIDKVIHSYNFDEKITEASVESNEFWKNPNLAPIKRCIVNYVSGSSAYKRGQQRLKESLEKHFKGDVILFDETSGIGEPPHSENPYAFKIYAIDAVREMGYNQVLWLDASVIASGDPEPVFQWLTEKGIFLEEAGHYAGTWSPKYVLKYFKVLEGEAMKMPMFAAGYCGFDFRNPISTEFFAEWKEAMKNGMFKGDWKTSRHDMTCGSIIANVRGLLPIYSKGGQFFSYLGTNYTPPTPTSVFGLQGVE